MKRIFVPILVLALAILACGSEASTPVVVSTAPSNTKLPIATKPPIATEPPTPTTAPLQTYNVGDAISIGDIIITVNEITFPIGDQFFKPDEGKKFIVIDLTVENKGASAYMLSSLLQMTLKDDTGQKFDTDFTASAVSGGACLTRARPSSFRCWQ